MLSIKYAKATDWFVSVQDTCRQKPVSRTTLMTVTDALTFEQDIASDSVIQILSLLTRFTFTKYTPIFHYINNKQTYKKANVGLRYSRYECLVVKLVEITFNLSIYTFIFYDHKSFPEIL